MEATLSKKRSKKDRQKEGESEQGSEERSSSSREKKSREKGEAKKKKGKKRSVIPKEDETSSLGRHNVAMEDDKLSTVPVLGETKIETRSDKQGETVIKGTGDLLNNNNNSETNLLSGRIDDSIQPPDQYLRQAEGEDKNRETLPEKSTFGSADSVRRRATLTEIGGSFEEGEMTGGQEISTTEVSVLFI